MRRLWSIILCIMMLFMCIPAAGLADENPADGPASSNADLSILEVAGYELDPDFAAEITDYTVNVTNEVDSVEITATAADENAVVNITGPADNLVVGDNEIAVEVTAEDGTIKTYTITATRAEEIPAETPPASSNADLSILEVAGYELDPDFEAEITDYAVDVPNEVEDVEITAAAEDENAVVNISGPVDNLAVGDNKIAVEVTAEDESTVKTYTITITRAEAEVLLRALGESELPLTPAEYAASDYVQYRNRIAVGGDHIAVVKADGTVEAWGDNTYGQCDVPEGLADVKALAASIYATLALKNDGTVVAWGSNFNSSGEIVAVNIPDTVGTVQGNIKLIAAGGAALAVVTESNQVIVWSKQLPNSQQTDILSNVVAVAVNSVDTMVVNEDGNVIAWGSNAGAKPGGLDGQTLDVAAGVYHCVALKKDGTVVVWGNHASDCNGISSQTGIKAVAGGFKYAAALLADGSVQGWGSMSPVNNNTEGIELIPASSNILAFSSAIEGNSAYICGLQEDGTLYVIGPDVPEGLNLLNSDSNADLENLVVAGYDLEPSFNSDKTQYTVDVPYEVSSVEITATKADDNAAVKITGPADNLAVGTNEISVEVTAEDQETTKTYTITITRASDAASSNAGLSSLVVTGCDLEPAFNSDTTEYAVTILNEVSSVNITAETADANASLKIGGTAAVSGTAQTVNNLVVGENIVTVEVTAQDRHTIKTYTITITIIAAEDLLPDQIILSWTGDPKTTQTAAWRSSSHISSGQVQYMKESEQTGDFSGAQGVYAICTQLYEGYNHFEAQLTDLEPGTTYVYRVGTENNWSEAAIFTTAASTDTFSFMYLGDTHIGYNENSSAVWSNLLADAWNDYPDIKFALHSGDLVDETTDISQWEDFFDIQSGYFDQIPFMPAIGNHEDEETSIYFKSFALPQNGPEGLEEHHYSFDYANAHFVVMDSNLMGIEGDITEAGMEWLETDLQNSTKDWNFVMFHHPAYEVTSYDSSICETIKEYWAPILERNDVDMAFVGHQHMYMRTYPLCSGAVQENAADGVTYVMGVSGNKTYLSPQESEYIAAVAEGADAISYCIINIDSDVLTLTTIGANGTVLDEYKISKNIQLNAKAGIYSVNLLDSSHEEINSVSSSETCHIKAHINNNTSRPQTVTTLFQLRSGSDANAAYGGEPQGIISLQSGIPAAGADIYADFDLSDVSPGTVYVDVYILDEAGVPIDMPYQFSFNLTA